MTTDGQPLSPHLTIYRWPITMFVSLFHRGTGVAMSVGLIAFVIWLEAIALGAVQYEMLKHFMDSFIGQFMLLGWCFSFFFHLSNGIRHLIWDTGRLFEKNQVDTSAWFVIVTTVVLTAGYWFLV